LPSFGINEAGNMLLAVHFLQTYVLVMMGLGAAVFVLLAVLPTILPSLRAALMQEIRQELKSPQSPKDEEELTKKLGRLGSKGDDIRNVLWMGAFSSLLLMLTGIWGLIVLVFPPVEVGGVVYVTVTDVVIGDGLFLLPFFGLIMMFIFGVTFMRLVSGYSKSSGSRNSEPKSKEPPTPDLQYSPGLRGRR